MTTLILSDVDGVMCDWTAGFLAFLREQHPDLLPAHNKPLVDNNNVHDWMGRSKEWVSEFIREAFQLTDYLSTVPTYRDAEIVIPMLRQGGAEFIAITAAGTHPAIAKRRQDFIEKHWPGVFKDVLCVPPLVSKRDALIRHTHANLWVEDAHHHWETGHELGIPSLHMLRPELLAEAEAQQLDWPRAPDQYIVQDWYGVLAKVNEGLCTPV